MQESRYSRNEHIASISIYFGTSLITRVISSFKSSIVCGLYWWYTFDFKCPHEKKSYVVKSGERGNRHRMSPKREMRSPGDFWRRNSTIAQAVCDVTPSCGIHTFLTRTCRSFSSGKNWVSMSV